MPTNKKKVPKKSKIQELLGLIITFISIFLMLLVFTDTSSQLVGKVGIYIRHFLAVYTGVNKYFLTIILFFFGLKLLLGKVSKEVVVKYLLFTSLIFFIVTSFHIPLLNTEFAYKISARGEGGGLISYYFSYILNYYFGKIGSYIALFLLSFISLILVMDFSFAEFLSKSLRLFLFPLRKEESKSNEEEYLKEETEDTLSKKDIEKFEEEKSVDRVATDLKESDLSLEKDDFLEKLRESEGTQYKDTYEDKVLPPLSFLTKKEQKKNKKFEEEVEYNKVLLEKKLESFGIEAKVVNVVKGPTITRYEIEPPQGVKVSKILNLGNDIALALGAPQIRIEAPVPGKKVIGIEVPNKEREVVYIRELLESQAFQNTTRTLPLALGKGMGGQPVISDLVALPHLLIAGATSSGKSVCINSIILSILYKFTPKEVKFLMIDPKRVELSVYEGIPHLVGPIVVDPKKAALALEWIIKEMERRFRIFADLGVRNLKGYNSIVEDLAGYAKMPFIVVIIDELADLMMIAPKDVEESLCRLAQMARATGIHLIVATQRPSVDVITGLIKANFPSRIAFTVSSQIDSRTIIDMNGAEKLLGKGDMLYFPVGVFKPIRAQGAYVSDNDVKKVVEFLRKKKTEEDDVDSIYLDEEELEREEVELDEDDELLKDALRVIYTYNRASASLLQRELKIGYPRAARLIGLLEKKGYIGPQEGSKPRKILKREESI